MRNKSLFFAFLVSLASLFFASCDGGKVRDISFLTDSNIEIKVGDTYHLVVYVTPLDAEYELQWNSSDISVASVDDEGLVVGRGLGQCTVTVSAGDVSAQCTISVVSDGEHNPDDVNITGYGAVNSLFSVSPYDQVRFSRGNLQYQASTGTWRFAEYQYASLGAENGSISQDNAGWIDLFGWGTSGWSGGAVAFQPYATDTDDSHYTIAGSSNNGLNGGTALADWGRYNAISNGGNVSGQWRTLSDEEWAYLFDTLGARKDKWALATINNFYKGVVLLPDQWVRPEGVSYSHGASLGYQTNQYTNQQWLLLQKSGAVFLPNAGIREGTNVSAVNYDGYYWASTPDGASAAHALYIMGNTVSPKASRNRHYGLSVRLVWSY